MARGGGGYKGGGSTGGGGGGGGVDHKGRCETGIVRDCGRVHH